jgi:hypothetical protein
MALRLQAEVALDGSGFERGLNRLATGAVSSFRNTVASAFGTLAIGQLVRGTIEWASRLNDVADQLGVNVEWLQKMQNGAKLVGGDIEDISKMILEINKSRQDSILNPAGKNALAFGRAGMSASDIQNLSTQAFVDKFISAFSKGVTTQGANDIQEVGGRAARNLIAAFVNQFASDTPILSGALIRELDDIGDRFTDLATALKVILAPAILGVMGLLLELQQRFGQLWEGLKGADRAGNVGAAADIQKGIPLMSRVANVFENWWKGFQKGVVGAEADQQDLADRIAMARSAVASARKRREESAPFFDLGGLKSGSFKSPATDALLSVGNFLGAGAGAINSIAQQQLDVARQSLRVQTDTAKDIRSMSESFRRGDMEGIEVP